MSVHMNQNCSLKELLKKTTHSPFIASTSNMHSNEDFLVRGLHSILISLMSTAHGKFWICGFSRTITSILRGPLHEHNLVFHQQHNPLCTVVREGRNNASMSIPDNFPLRNHAVADETHYQPTTGFQWCLTFKLEDLGHVDLAASLSHPSSRVLAKMMRFHKLHRSLVWTSAESKCLLREQMGESITTTNSARTALVPLELQPIEVHALW